MALNAKQKAILDGFIEECKINAHRCFFEYYNPWTFTQTDIINADDLHDDHWRQLRDDADIPEVGWEVNMSIIYSEVNTYLRTESQKHTQ